MATSTNKSAILTHTTRTRGAGLLNSGLGTIWGSTATVVATDAMVGSCLADGVGISSSSVGVESRTGSERAASARSSVGVIVGGVMLLCIPDLDSCTPSTGADTAFDSTGARKI